MRDERASPPISHRSRPIPSDDLDRDLPYRLAGIIYGAALGVLFGLPLGYLLGARGFLLIAFTILAAVAMGWFIRRFTAGVGAGVANALLRMVWPTGHTTPYARTYSREQALAVRGDHKGAAEAYAAAMALHPDDPEPRIQAAELQFRGPTPEAAVPLFVEARRLAAGDRARELYTTQRLIDLYLGPLNQPDRARVELRRLVDRFPGTREAESAKEFLKRLKQS